MGTCVCVHVCSVCVRVQRVCVCSVCARACVWPVCAACGYVCTRVHVCVCVYSMWARVRTHTACVRVCARAACVYMCARVRRVCTCVCACARLPCLHGALWAPWGPDCAPPRHRGCRSAPSSAQTRPDRVCPTGSFGHPFAASQWPVWSCSGRHFGKGQLSNSWQGRSGCVRKGEFRGRSWGPGGARAGREGGGGSAATQPQVRVLPASAGM